MFSLLNGVYDSYLAPTELNILVVGPPSVGKTTLLERMKVTRIPNRPTPADITYVPLTAALHEAFVKGGAETPQEGSTTAQPEEQISLSPAKSLVKTTPLPTPAPVVVHKRRFKLSICPAPKRYSKAEQDQEEDFVDDEHVNAQEATSNTDGSKEEEILTLRDPSSPEAPLRVRCHSKEFDVKTLDISDSAVGERRIVRMESIPLDDAPALPSLKPLANNQELFASLVQEQFEELHLKPKARMLPMTKIRPTSTYSLQVVT
jgi:hypothetical protein